MQPSKKVILAYSGGLDTSVILHWLIQKGYEVVTYTANLGQGDDYELIKSRATSIGATQSYIPDLRKEFVENFIFESVKANALYEGRYLLGTSLARPLTAKAQVEIGKQEKAQLLSHGATGKGNDQARFEFTFSALGPEFGIYSPWRDPEFLEEFQGRSDLIEYADKYKIEVEQTKSRPWSSDANLMHISYEAGELEDPNRKPREDMFNLTTSPQNAPDKETEIEIEYLDGIPIKLTNITENVVRTDSLELFIYLNQLAGINGIGREDIVENRLVGLKSRGVYETPAATILQKTHRDIEGLTMDREAMHLRDSLIPRYSELVYYGFWYSPEMELLQSLFTESQKNVSGIVNTTLYKGNVIINSRYSENSLYNEQMVSMDSHGGFDSTDSTGFIHINSHRLRAYFSRGK
jgi:argininosuccinate synthase|tara:strand:- start:5743 stop:6966 length:1224 start_codon:yes stop_codon:yes gene_type:complete